MLVYYYSIYRMFGAKLYNKLSLLVNKLSLLVYYLLVSRSLKHKTCTGDKQRAIKRNAQ